ncbi:MAG: hypothetical protein ACR2OL_07270 [Anderseniella sp.]
MSTRLFTGGVMIGGVIMAAYGGLELGGVLGGAPFDYAKATSDEQVQFLQKETKYFGRRLKRGLVNPSGVGGSMRLADTEYDARRNEVRFIVRVTGGELANNGASQKAQREFQKAACAWRGDSRLAGANSRLVVKFVDKDKRQLRRITIDGSSCRRFS